MDDKTMDNDGKVEEFKKFPFFKFYPLDFLSDEKVAVMTPSEVGAYVLLLCVAWHQDPPGTLPDDDTVLAKWSRMTRRVWMRHKSKVMAPFDKLSDDKKYFQKRMVEVYEESFCTYQKLANSGRTGGKRSKKKSQAKAGLEPGLKKEEARLAQISDIYTSQDINRAREVHANDRPDDFSDVPRPLPRAEDKIGFEKPAPCTLDDCIFALRGFFPTESIERLKLISEAYISYNNENGWEGVQSWRGYLKGFYRKVKYDPKFCAQSPQAAAEPQKTTETALVCRKCFNGALVENTGEDFCTCNVPAAAVIEHRKHLKAYEKPKDVSMREFCDGLKERAKKI